MKYPAIWLMEPGARGETLSIAFAGEGSASGCRSEDGSLCSKHLKPHHQQEHFSRWRAFQLSRPGEGPQDATNCRSNVVCDALILDSASRSDTYPYIEVEEENVAIEHEASVSKIAEEQLFY